MREKALFAAAALFASCPFVFADFVSDVEKVRAQTWNASASFNEAVNSASSYFSLMNKMRSDAQSVFDGANSVSQKSSSALANLESLEGEFSAFKTSFEANVRNCNASAKSLEDALKNLPLGRERIDATRKLIGETRKIVSQNAGENFQDKRYFDSVDSRFASAAGALVSARASAARVSVAASVNAPRVEGIKAAVAMAENYISKTAEAETKNAKSAKRVVAAASEFSDEFGAALSRYENLGEICQDARSRTLSAAFKTSAFVLNTLSKSEKYGKQIFTQAESVNLSSMPSYYRPSVKRKLLKAERLSRALGVSAYAAENASMPSQGWTANSMADSGANSSDRAAPAPDKSKVRAEILAACAEIEFVSAELRAATDALNQIVSSAETSLSAISNLESGASKILRSSIDAYAQSQTLSSDILLLDINIKTFAAQNKISSAKMGELYDASKSDFGKAKKDAATIESRLDELAKEVQ